MDILNTIRLIEKRGYNPMSVNPYTPGAGSVPPFLAGREKVLFRILEQILWAREKGFSKHTVFYGVRGVGKTVLLNAIASSLELNQDIMCMHFECVDQNVFSDNVAYEMKQVLLAMNIEERAKDAWNKAKQVLKSFVCTWHPEDSSLSVGLGDDRSITEAISGNFELDVKSLFINIGRAAKEKQRTICIFIDEMHAMKKSDLSALIGAVHRCNQLQLPIFIIGAGLPTILRLSCEAKSYAERLFYFSKIDHLSNDAAIAALVKPAQERSVYYTDEAIRAIINETGGYAYFVQAYGECVWNNKQSDIICAEDVQKSYNDYTKSLDSSFYSSRYHRTTPREKQFLNVMANIQKRPCQVSDIAKCLGVKTTSISVHRANLINKGLIYSPSFGEVDFTVPQFDRFLNRIG